MAETTERAALEFARRYLTVQQSAMRGGRRMRSRKQIRDDVRLEFPEIGWWLLFKIVLYIWRRL